LIKLKRPDLAEKLLANPKKQAADQIAEFDKSSNNQGRKNKFRR
jgi:hypothetical protein